MQRASHQCLHLENSPYASAVTSLQMTVKWNSFSPQQPVTVPVARVTHWALVVSPLLVSVPGFLLSHHRRPTLVLKRQVVTHIPPPRPLLQAPDGGDTEQPPALRGGPDTC